MAFTMSNPDNVVIENFIHLELSPKPLSGENDEPWPSLSLSICYLSLMYFVCHHMSIMAHSCAGLRPMYARTLCDEGGSLCGCVQSSFCPLALSTRHVHIMIVVCHVGPTVICSFGLPFGHLWPPFSWWFSMGRAWISCVSYLLLLCSLVSSASRFLSPFPSPSFSELLEPLVTVYFPHIYSLVHVPANHLLLSLGALSQASSSDRESHFTKLSNPSVPSLTCVWVTFRHIVCRCFRSFIPFIWEPVFSYYSLTGIRSGFSILHG